MYSDFTLFPHKSKKHGKIYYVRFRDPETGNRLSPITTNQTSKAAAERWAMEYLSSAKLNHPFSDTFENFAKGWFIDKTCPYIQAKLEKHREFSEDYAALCRSRLNNHILPFIKRIQAIRYQGART